MGFGPTASIDPRKIVFGNLSEDIFGGVLCLVGTTVIFRKPWHIEAACECGLTCEPTHWLRGKSFVEDIEYQSPFVALFEFGNVEESRGGVRGGNLRVRATESESS